MLATALCICLLCATFALIFNIAVHDPEFKEITVTKADRIYFAAYMAVFSVILIRLPFFSKLYAAIALPVLLVSAYTDKKTKLLYKIVFYVLAPLSIVMETLQASFQIQNGVLSFSFQPSFQTLPVIILVSIVGLLKMYGNGDKGMAVICGCIWYLMFPERGWAEAALVECIMIMISQITFYLRAVKEKNLEMKPENIY